MMADFIKFNTNGVIKKVAVDKLVLKERDCTQTGSTFHIMEMGALETNPENANPVAQVSTEEFQRFRKAYPNAHIVRLGTD